MEQNNNELYHYNYGLGLYNGVGSDELYHYGVKGMKWGEKRVAKLDAKVKKLQAKRDARIAKKGIMSRSARRAATKQAVASAKLDLKKAKLKGDKLDKVIAKEDLKTAKSNRRDFNLDSATDRDIKRAYGNKISSKDILAIRAKDKRRRKASAVVDRILYGSNA